MRESTNEESHSCVVRGGDFAGVAANVIGNFSERDSEGLQIGLVNSAGRLNGVQVGLLNNSRAQLSFPILNAGC